MTSGLRYNGTGSGGGPFGDDARTYYDPDLRALALAVNVEVPPGGRWHFLKAVVAAVEAPRAGLTS